MSDVVPICRWSSNVGVTFVHSFSASPCAQVVDKDTIGLLTAGTKLPIQCDERVGSLRIDSGQIFGCGDRSLMLTGMRWRNAGYGTLMYIQEATARVQSECTLGLWLIRTSTPMRRPSCTAIEPQLT